MITISLQDSCRESCHILIRVLDQELTGMFGMILMKNLAISLHCLTDNICQEMTTISLQDSYRESCHDLIRVLDQELTGMFGMILTKDLVIKVSFVKK